MDEQRKRQTVDLTAAELAEIRRIATRYGLIVSSGRAAGRGSFPGLTQAIASGRLLVVENPNYQDSGN